MMKKMIRLLVVLLIGTIAYFSVVFYGGNALSEYNKEAVNLNTNKRIEYIDELHVTLSPENLYAYFYGYNDMEQDPSVIYIVTEIDSSYLIIQLDYKIYYEVIRDWFQNIHYNDEQFSAHSIEGLEGSLKVLDENLKAFILETQEEYLGEEIEEKLIPYIFVENYIGSFTFGELENLNILKTVILGITVMIAVVCLIFPIKKKDKRKIEIQNEEKESEEN